LLIGKDTIDVGTLLVRAVVVNDLRVLFLQVVITQSIARAMHAIFPLCKRSCESENDATRVVTI
jgi:hypothetical protein